MTEMTTPTAQEAPAANVGSVEDQIANLLSGEPEQDEAEQTSVTEDTPADDESDEEQAEADGDDDDSEAEESDSEESEKSLHEYMGLDPDQVVENEETGEFSVVINVNGEKSTATMREVLAGYQTQKYNTHKSQELSRERKEFEEVAEGKVTEIKQHLELNQALTTKLHEQLMAEFNQTDWDNLRNIDPAEYAARKHDAEARFGQLQRVHQEISQMREYQSQQADNERNHYASIALQGQAEQMLDNNPTWRDPSVHKKATVEIRTFLENTYNFNDTDMAGISDARAIALIQDAKAYREGRKVAEKRTIKAPKLQKSKRTSGPKDSKLQKLTRDAKAATGSNRRDAQDNAIAELLSSL